MSFVFAEKNDKSLDIYSDTKIMLTDNAIAYFSGEQMDLLKKYGIVKTTIICPQISISFAGNDLFLASKLFEQLYEKRVFSTEDVIEMAFEIHKSAKKDDIEFIIASCEDKQLSLNCIKDGNIQYNCAFAWIGSYQAHCRFQEYRLRDNLGSAHERTVAAFLDVISGCGDETVGGFVTHVNYNSSKDCIQYSEEVTFRSSKQQNVKQGEAIHFYLNAEDGGCTYRQIPVSCEEMLLIIDQIKPQILYSRNKRCTKKDVLNKQLFSLMLPMLVCQNEKGEFVRC